MSISRYLALTGCLLALHAPAHAQVPPPGAAFSFLGRTPDSGFTSLSVLGTGGQEFCRESTTILIDRDDPDVHDLVCGWLGSFTDSFQVIAYNLTYARPNDAPGQYWLHGRLGGYMRVLPLSGSIVRTSFWGHASAWTKEGIMFRAHNVLRVKIESYDTRPDLWIERCDAGGCTLLDRLEARPLPWIITLPANRPPKQATANPPVNEDFENEYYRIQASVFVDATGSPSDFVMTLDEVDVRRDMNVLVSIYPACIPDTAGC